LQLLLYPERTWEKMKQITMMSEKSDQELMVNNTVKDNELGGTDLGGRIRVNG